MSSLVRYTREKLRWLMPVLAVAFVATACELDVSDPSQIRDEEVTGPSAVPTQLNGVIGDLTIATEHYVLYSGMLTDEFILAGTFPTRLEVDQRRVSSSNGTLEAEVDENLQVARNQADAMVSDFQGLLGNEDFSQATLRDGIAIGQFVGGLSRLWLGEIFCTPVIEEAGSPVASDVAVEEALALFQQAESSADEAGLAQWVEASKLYQARANLWLGNFDEAAAIAADVPRTHRLLVEYSVNDPSQFNKVFELTFSSQNESIRWTVGDGNQASRQNEKFAIFDELVEIGVIDPDPPASVPNAFDSTIDVHLQLMFDAPEDAILISTGVVADLIEAEAMIRNGQTQMAEDMINQVRADFDERWTIERFPISTDLDPVELTGNMQEDLVTISREYAREAWMSGMRQETLRRFVREFGDDTSMDLYPEKPGDDECFPVTEQEDTGATP